MSHLLEFYGDECPHCEVLRSSLDQLEKEEKVKIDRYEIWHNKENEELMEKYDTDLCGGVPFLFNTKTKKWICGEATMDELKSWAKGK